MKKEDLFIPLSFLSKYIPNYQLGGSASLLLYDIISRDINDLDIIVPSFTELIPILDKLVSENKIENYEKVINYLGSNLDDDGNEYGESDDTIDAINIIFYHNDEEFVNGVSINIFEDPSIDKLEWQYFDIMYNNEITELKVKVSDPLYAINAKINYIKTMIERKNVVHSIVIDNFCIPFMTTEKDKRYIKHLSDIQSFISYKWFQAVYEPFFSKQSFNPLTFIPKD